MKTKINRDKYLIKKTNNYAHDYGSSGNLPVVKHDFKRGNPDTTPNTMLTKEKVIERIVRFTEPNSLIYLWLFAKNTTDIINCGTASNSCSVNLSNGKCRSVWAFPSP